ncbi:hypothetical protein WJX75_007285 [Coccomyxa subellipsoidea]|uniref:Apple domain-containing protein n=1 Tax=Coccomyxa subellipsoidea TaxID=248742 RepID=A0ABR2YUH2_9CHLO
MRRGFLLTVNWPHRMPSGRTHALWLPVASISHLVEFVNVLDAFCVSNIPPPFQSAKDYNAFFFGVTMHRHEVYGRPGVVPTLLVLLLTCGSTAHEVAGQLLTASEFDKIVDLDSLFECAETCHNDELCVSFEWEPATGVCKSSILPAGSSTSRPQMALDRASSNRFCTHFNWRADQHHDGSCTLHEGAPESIFTVADSSNHVGGVLSAPTIIERVARDHRKPYVGSRLAMW